MTQGEGVAERASRVYAVDINLSFFTRDEIHRAFQEGKNAIMELFVRVEQPVQALAEHVEAQTAALKEVQARLGKNSANSSKPPSSAAIPGLSLEGPLSLAPISFELD
jgi:hypothetical protein